MYHIHNRIASRTDNAIANHHDTDTEIDNDDVHGIGGDAGHDNGSGNVADLDTGDSNDNDDTIICDTY